MRLFGLTDYFIDGFREAWSETVRHLRAARAETEWVSYVVGFGVPAVYLGTLATLGLAVVHGTLGPGSLATAALALTPLTSGILPGRDDLNIAWGAESARAVRELEDEVARTRPAGAPHPAPPSTALPAAPTASGQSARSASDTGATTAAQATPAGLAARLECRGLRYGYPGGAEVFAGLDLVLEPGRSVALVGENGAGKTTLAMLLAGLLAPTDGEVVVDDHTLDHTTRPSWQRQSAVLFQDFVRYQGTSLYDNVAFGAVEHLVDRGAVEQVGSEAGLDDVVSGMPLGWQSVLGPAYQSGSDLSGGQWQRVGLARCLFALRHGARLLILDEPAASLDVAAETELYDRFLELTGGVTTIIVSHRLAAVRHADRIIVIEGGRVVEDGPHETLMRRGGGYAEMFELQSSRFNEARS